jgi:transcriptional regulator with XRE-family HTH domain
VPLREARIRARLTQKDLAKRVPADHTYISKMEKGLFLPTRKLALGLADALGISDPEERNKFLLAAGVLNEEDLKGFQLVNVGQAIIQGVPAQQLPSAAGIQQILTQLQAVTAAVAQLTAKVAELLQSNTATSSDLSLETPRVGEGAQPSAEQRPSKTPPIIMAGRGMVRDLETKMREALHIGTAVGERIIEWKKQNDKRHDLGQATEWEEKWTKVVEQKGDLFIVMRGIQGWTLPQRYYDEQVKTILESKGEEAEKVATFISHALACRERRRIAFETQVQRYKFRHIMPIGALEEYRRTGFHRPDEWVRIFKGNPVPPETQAEHIRHIIGLLEDEAYKNYELGLLLGSAGETNFYKYFFWEIKASHTVVWEDLREGETDCIIRNPSFVGDFCQYFDWLWESEDVIKDKKTVKGLLEEHIKSLPKAPAIS